MNVIEPLNTPSGKLGAYMFWCPGCVTHHSYDVSRWTFNGNFEKPTFSPSLLINQHDPKTRCHLFVREGKIEYCSDCHHELAGKTIDMEPMD